VTKHASFGTFFVRRFTGVLTGSLSFVGEYNESMKVNEGGGLEAEQENIEVLEMKYEEAYNKIAVAK
jgi:hypothetical protein